MVISDDQLKQLIVSSGLINEEELKKIIKFAKNSNIGLAEALVEKDVVPDEYLGRIIANYLNFPFINLSKTSIPEEVFSIISEKIARRKKIIPFARDETGVKLAMADPTNTQIQEMIAKKTNQVVFPFFATERDIHNTLYIYRKDLQETIDKLLKKEIDKKGKLHDDAPIIKIVNLLIDYAYQYKASDLHIEPLENNSLVRFRIDGILHDVLNFPKKLHDRVITRIKVLSKLRTDEHLSPQDGNIRLKLEEENLDIRVSILPLVDGEKAVLRLLASRFRQLSLADLGMNQHDLQKITAAISKSFGMILATGPTGSGKTTAIYAILKILNQREKNITTIEDPVEYRIKGVNQIQVNPKTNLTFAQGLRTILRQDPNIIFVGEIRDVDTAGIAVNAALTGHLVLSTLHTNDAPTALPRLIDMKVEPFLVASTVNVIIAQRLVRKICEMCKASLSITQEELLKHISKKIFEKHFCGKNEITIYKGKGCKICHSTGYVGRIGIFEVLEVTEKLRKLISVKSDSDVIKKAAIEEGMNTMLDDGLQKVANGITTIEEVLRVTRVQS